MIKKISMRIDPENVLRRKDDGIFVRQMLKTASGLKNGDQRLYAQPEDILDKYGDFDIIEEMKFHPQDFLWCRARAIDADTPNENGDYFSKEELLSEVEAGKKGTMPAYKTFEGVPIYTNHQNDDVAEAKGEVVYAEWDDDENCVYCTFYIDSEAWPKLARGVREGYIHDVSMGCHVDYSRCNICNQKATKESEYCEHVKEFKGKRFSGIVNKGKHRGKRVNNEIVYEKNYGIKFIELSCVSDGAFENCSIEQLLDVNDFVEKADKLAKTSESVKHLIARNIENDNIIENDELQEVLIEAMNTSQRIYDYAQAMGGIHRLQKIAQAEPIMGVKDAFPEEGSLVEPMTGEVAPMQESSTAPASPSNVLDMLNQSMLLVEEVSKVLIDMHGDVNMDHMKDLGKILSDIQKVISNLIDDGIGSLVGGNNVALSPGQQGQQAQPAQPEQAQPAPQAPPAPEQGQASAGQYQPAGQNVGVQMASANDSIKTLTASIKAMSETVSHIKDDKRQDKPIKEGSRKMEQFTKVAANYRDSLSNKVVESFSREMGPFKVVVSTSGQVEGYYHGQKLDWDPYPSENQLEKIEDGRIDDFAADMLDEFKQACTERKVVTSAKDADLPAEGTERRLMAEEQRWNRGRLGYPDVVNEDYIVETHKGAAEYPMERYLEEGRKGENSNREDDLSGYNPKYELGRQGETPTTVNEARIVDEHDGVDNRVTEHRLESRRAGNAPKATVASSIQNSLASAIIDARVSPEEVVEASRELANDKDALSILGAFASSEHKNSRDVLRKRASFGQKEAVETMKNVPLKSIVAGSLADHIDGENITSYDIVTALKTLHEIDETRVAKAIGGLAKQSMADGDLPHIAVEGLRGNNELKTEFLKSFAEALGEDAQEITRDDIKLASNALVDAVQETTASPDEIMDAIEASTVEDIHAEIEGAMDDTATEKRAKNRKRLAFYRSAQTEDLSYDDAFLRNSLVGNIADNLLNVEATNKAKTVAAAIKKLSGNRGAVNCIAKALLASRMQKKAYSLSDRADREFTIRFSLDEVGCEPGSPEFEESFQRFASDVLSSHGYDVGDPGSLTFTNLDIRKTGESVASIRSSVLRDYGSDGSAPASDACVVTAGGKKARKEARSNLVRMAQAPEMGGAPMPGGAPAPTGGAPTGDGAPAAAGAPGDEGLLSFTGAPAEGEEGEASEGPEGALPTPGEKQPPGSVCPACGSIDVDFASSRGSCNSCGTEFEATFDIKILNPGEESDQEMEEGGDEDMLEDLGPAGEAPIGPEEAPEAPPAGGAPPAGPAGPGAPPPTPMANTKRRVVTANDDTPIWVKLSWNSGPEVFIRTAQAYDEGKDPASLPVGVPLSVGHVCPSCGDKQSLIRRAFKDSKTAVWCDECGTTSFINVEKGRDGKSLLNTVEYEL